MIVIPLLKIMRASRVRPEPSPLIRDAWARGESTIPPGVTGRAKHKSDISKWRQ